MRVALVHYWLVNMRGGEKVLEALCRMFPEADVFTLFYEPERVSPLIRSRRVVASFLNPLRRYYRSLLPLTPLALERFDLRGYDLVISSESGPAKGVLAGSRARHVCYCHTPMRYLWDLYHDYLDGWAGSTARRTLMHPMAHYLRLWDQLSAARVDAFAANSQAVQRRIQRAWGRESRVIYPPVAVESFYAKPAEDYFLVAGELVAYKRIDTAVRVFTASGRKLRIVGEGPEYKRLRRAAGANVEFCGRLSDGALRELYASCRALVMPGEEDFGIAPVEALASGKPVIALARGGALETVRDGERMFGLLYEDASDDGLAAAVEQFERVEGSFSAGELQEWAARFREARFVEEMGEFVATADR